MAAMSQAQNDAKPIYKEGEPASRRHVWLYDDDWTWIEANVDAVKKSKFVRLCVRKTIRAMKAKAEEQN